MVQRTPTFVFPGEWLVAAEDVDYRPDTDPEVVDRKEFTYPHKILREMVNQEVHSAIRANLDRFDALESAGCMLNRFGDIYDNLYIRFGGHYVDIGCSERIAKGDIKVQSQPVVKIVKDGLSFRDGTEVKADVIVLCTGFNHNVRIDAARILGDIADQVDDFYGIDSEGELKGHARPAGRKYRSTSGRSPANHTRCESILPRWRRTNGQVLFKIHRASDSS